MKSSIRSRIMFFLISGIYEHKPLKHKNSSILLEQTKAEIHGAFSLIKTQQYWWWAIIRMPYLNSFPTKGVAWLTTGFPELKSYTALYHYASNNSSVSLKLINMNNSLSNNLFPFSRLLCSGCQRVDDRKGR